jgi:hypothetical protein
MGLTGRQLAMQRLLDAAKNSWVSDIDRASLFLERAREVRLGCRESRNASRKSQASAGRRKAAKEDKPLTWD